MNKKDLIQVFSNAELGSVRVIGEGCEAMFCLVDVAKCLEYSDARKAVCDHCKKFVMVPTQSNSGVQETRFGKIAEVFRLIMKSRCEKAQQFQDWVCEEVGKPSYG